MVSFSVLVYILPLVSALPFNGYFDPRIGYYQLVKLPDGNYQWKSVYFPGVEKKLPPLVTLLDSNDQEDSDPDLASLGQVLDFGLSPDSSVLDDPSVIKSDNVIDIMKENGNFKNFLQIIDHFGLKEELKSKPQITIFAPSDDIFANHLGLIISETDLKRHLIAVALPLESIETGPAFTLSGETVDLVKIGKNGVQVQFGDSTAVNIVQADILASNGVIHVIDQIISE